jgi:hypothetical protein
MDKEAAAAQRQSDPSKAGIKHVEWQRRKLKLKTTGQPIRWDTAYDIDRIERSLPEAGSDQPGLAAGDDPVGQQ